MAENSKFMARVPIIPDDITNQEQYQHKDHEMVLDFWENDIYVKVGDEYVNITGKLKEEIELIKQSSAVIHIVTEDSLPPVDERPENHWYYVITGSTIHSEDIDLQDYVYYGIVDMSEESNIYKYILVVQNTILGSDVVHIDLVNDFKAVFYVPDYYTARFTNNDTGDIIDYTIENKVYAVNDITGLRTAYDIYILDLSDPGSYFINVTITDDSVN